jgi:N-succinyldiaminopimelate aminotransferase
VSTQALVDPGDEVIMFEPFFPWYAPDITLAGGVGVTVRLQPPNFNLDINRIEECITPRTKLMILNR